MTTQDEKVILLWADTMVSLTEEEMAPLTEEEAEQQRAILAFDYIRCKDR